MADLRGEEAQSFSSARETPSQGQALLCLGFLTLLLCTGGCGGSGSTPAGPTVATNPTPFPSPAGASSRFDVFDGVTGAAVGAGQFAVGSAPSVSFSGGFEAGPIGGSVAISVPGYLRRETTLPGGGRISVWPAADRTEEEYTRTLVYVNAIDNVTERTLFRLPIGAYEVSLSPELDVPTIRDVFNRVFSRIREATRGAVTFGLGGSVPLVVVSIDASVAPFAAFTNWNSSGGYINSGRIRVINLARAQDEALLLHEFGHMSGLQHSNRTDDVMHPSARISQMTTRELVTVAMLFQRPAGTRFPDSDGGLSFRSSMTDRQFSCGR